jgi:hypothetical protein
MDKKFLSAAFAACIANPFVSMPIVAVGSAIALPTVAVPAHAGTFPGWGGIVGDTLPCQPSLSRFSNSCILLHERINLFQGLRGSKPALQYCREKYGSNASVVWRLGMRWCATPDEA